MQNMTTLEKSTSGGLRSGKSIVPQGLRPKQKAKPKANADTIKDKIPTPESTSSNDEEPEVRDIFPYPNYSDDPDPLPQNASKEKEAAYKAELAEYSSELFTAYQKSKMRGEILWNDFITAFRPHTLRTWPRSVIIEWRDLLTQRGIYIEPNRRRSPIEAIIDILYREEHIGPKHEIEVHHKPRTLKYYEPVEEEIKVEPKDLDEKKTIQKVDLTLEQTLDRNKKVEEKENTNLSRN